MLVMLVGGAVQAIEDMPAEESPEVFGLHANADLTFRTLQARDRLQIFRDTRPAESSRKAGASREDVVDKMAEELLAKVRSGASSSMTPVRYTGPAWHVCREGTQTTSSACMLPLVAM